MPLITNDIYIKTIFYASIIEIKKKFKKFNYSYTDTYRIEKSYEYY